MKLYQLQFAILAAWLVVGWTLTSMPKLGGPSKAHMERMCSAPPDDMARRVCANLSER